MFNTIHIFGYGETQLIDGEINIKKISTDLSSFEPFLNHLKSLQHINSDFHVIHIFNGREVRCFSYSKSGNDHETFPIKFDLVDQALLNALVQELKA